MKSVLIIFSDVHLPYSPTTLNLFFELKKHCKVTLVAIEPEPDYSSQKISDPDIVYLSATKNSFPLFLKKLISKIKRIYFSIIKVDNNSFALKNDKAKQIIKYVKQFSGEIIAIDFFALWCVQQAGKKAHLVSFEIYENDVYKNSVDFSSIKSVVIQSETRYDYVFKKNRPKHFIIQNAPLYIDFKPNYSKRERTKLIYCGSAMPWFGIIACIDFIKDYPDYSLTIKGAVPKATLESINSFYKDLVTDERLIIDNSYLDSASLTLYVSNFRIGFGFYDFYRFENVRSVNYYTAPSGKIFQYLNSGVPIVANRLQGFEFIEKQNAGVLISHLSSIAIKTAIDKIESDYEIKSVNAKQISKNLDFLENAKPFIQYLLEAN